MTSVEADHITDPQEMRGSIRQQQVMLLAAVCALVILTAIGIKGLSAQKWVFVIGAVVAPVLVYGVFWRPQLFTYLVVFLLYCNLPVVAMKFHGVPFIIAAAVPGLLLFPILHTLIVRREPIVFPPVTLLVILFVVVQAIGTVFSKEPHVAIENVLRSLTEGVAAFALIITAVRTPQTLRGATWALLIAGALMGGVSAHQYARGAYDKNYGGLAQIEDVAASGGSVFRSSGDRRAAGTVGEKNRFAQNMLMLIPLGLLLFKGERSVGNRTLLATLILLTTLGWAVAFSRGCAVGFALTAVVGVFLGCLRFRHLAFIAVAGVVLILAMPRYQIRLASLVALTGAFEGKRTLAHTVDGSVRGRLTEMQAAARVFADHPLVGVGPGVFPYHAREYGKHGGIRALESKRQSHSLYLGLAAEHGIFGLACFLGLVGMTLRNLLRARHRCCLANPAVSHLACGYALALIAYLTSGLFLHFSFVRFFWLVLGLANAAIHVANQSLHEACEEGDSPLGMSR